MTINFNVINTLNLLGKEGLKLIEDNDLLNVLIQKLISSKIIENVILEDNVYEELKTQVFKNQNLKSQEEFENWLKKSNLSEDKFFFNITQNIKLTKYCTEEFGHITESLFLEKQDELDYATYSLIRVKDIYLANELFLRVKEGEANFGDIATEFTVGPEKDTKGIVGPAPVSRGHPAIQELIRSTEIGVIQEPIRIGSQFVIFRLEVLKKSILNEETKIALSKELFSNWLKEQTNEVIQCLKVR